ncbi:MAG: amidohydrolase family protein [Candidatus Marinimicrobia bacterium]|nr:amidohydrolase family protein [FCB group bacterium]MBL7023938.1 amidohydrolase family protein [Candidatus Neomarinimicrobiota bacterium]
MKNSILLVILTTVLLGQTEPLKDLMHVNPRVFVLQNAVVHIEPGQSISNASIVIRDGIILEVGTKVNVPEDAAIIDMDGDHIYAGFIDAWVDVDSMDLQQSHRSHWIDVVHPEWVASDSYTPDDRSVKERRKLGFTQLHTGLTKGIFRGQSSLIDMDGSASITIPAVSQVLDFYTRDRGEDGYPEALLGTIAVMRQTLYDAEWYEKAQKIYTRHPDKNEQPTADLALATLAEARSQGIPFLFRTAHETAAQRAIDISNEFDLKLWLIGSGYEYRRLSEIAEANPFIILPLNFPGKPDVTQPYRADQYTTEQLKHWDMAPDNAQKLVNSGVEIAFTSHGLEDLKQFRKNLVMAIERGLTETAALAALTTTPAKHFGLAKTHGKIKAGYQANFVVVRGNYFEASNPVQSIWVRGSRYDIDLNFDDEFDGLWDFSLEEMHGELTIKASPFKTSGSIKLDTTTISLDNLKLDGSQISWSTELPNTTPGMIRFKGFWTDEKLSGVALYPDGKEHEWMASNHTAAAPQIDTSTVLSSELKLSFPEGAFGFEQLPQQPSFLFINDATLWTSGPQGIIEKGDLLIQKGKIKKVGTDLTPPRGAMIIEANGKFVTPGLIDSHSHTAAASVNEGSQSITSEVRIQDVLDPDDISIYRELAGGLTTIQVLHGSANTIGGQNSVIKLRWGSDAHDLIMKRAPQGLKFALGENVKQSNWGDKNVTRYPQTRMGVEQILRDGFTRARDYKTNLENYSKRSLWRKTLTPPRRNLELDPLVEVLEGTRRVHVHSYRQDEILMMLRVAEDFGFTVTNMEHVLEGYKVADEMARHGAGAATFSDWWAYKFEVYDAIPYNAALMQNAGVLVSFKSDSDELARRMNLEAAKGIKYGGMTEIEALNTVTINPAKQLKIDKWVGSLEEGKDADFAVWSHSPLSTQAVCEQTWVDGKPYFSLEQNAELLAHDKQLRLDIIQKILTTKDEDRQGASADPENHKYQRADRDNQAWEGGAR